VADRLPFDILDPTKLIPEEVVPLEVIGRLTLNRYPDNFFAETEQAAFHPGHVVPGIDFTDDPLLQGRLFSYLDTQLIRLGGPNFHELPINAPKCPMRNFQRDGIHRMAIAKGRVSYEPNSLAPDSPRETPDRGFTTVPQSDTGAKVRERSASFADHYSQARLFFNSMTEPERRHIVSAFTFELSKVETVAIRTRMLGHLDNIHPDLGAQVAEGLGMEGQADDIRPAVKPVDLKPSPALSLIAKAPKTLEGRKVGVMVADGTDNALVDAVKAAARRAKARVEIVAPKIGGAKGTTGPIPADHIIPGAPSVMFDAVAVLVTGDAAELLSREAAAVDWVRDAFGHLKVIGHVAGAEPLLTKAGIEADAGVVEVETPRHASRFIDTAKNGRIWDREPQLRNVGP
jgi:catalase